MHNKMLYSYYTWDAEHPPGWDPHQLSSLSFFFQENSGLFTSTPQQGLVLFEEDQIDELNVYLMLCKLSHEVPLTIIPSENIEELFNWCNTKLFDKTLFYGKVSSNLKPLPKVTLYVSFCRQEDAAHFILQYM